MVLTSLQGPVSESGLLSLNIPVFSLRTQRSGAERDGCFRRLLCLSVEKFGCSLCTDAPLPSQKIGDDGDSQSSLSPIFFLGEGDVCAQAIRLKFKGEEINASQSVFKLAGEHFIKFISKRTVYLSFPKTAPVKPNGEVLST